MGLKMLASIIRTDVLVREENPDFDEIILFGCKFMKMANGSSLLTAFQRDQGAVRAQTGHPAWGSYSNDLLSWGLARPREGSLKKFFMEFTLASDSSLYMMSKKVAD